MVKMLCFYDHGIYDPFMRTKRFEVARGTARSATFDLPRTDVVALLRELSARGPDAALPQNLSDVRLRALVRDIVANDGLHDRMAVKILAMTLAAVQKPDLKLEETRDGNHLFESEPLSSYLRSYQLALISELVDRQVGVHGAEYAVENFFDQVKASRRNMNTV
ncbi:hypothetical protein [Caballeronia sp. BCC1704]|uniref:hypothetical protein n=1 Tax=Caballeronia sp. BCC1704 TaxID=2676300 RepID=UPI001589697C|nr:hypothetical protein [Caballeronia sp. BCC1704]